MKYQKSWASCVANMYHVDSNCFTLSSSSAPCTSNWLLSSGIQEDPEFQDRQAEDVQLHERGKTEEKLEEAIEKGVLVVCKFHEAYLRYQLDYADYSSHLGHPT